MTGMRFTRGLAEVGDDVYAYLLPTGTWGESNSGLIVSGDSAMLVDTLFTLDLTREMLETVSRALPAARSIDVLVNTHADGDHTWGNQLVEGARIIATEGAAEELKLGLGFTPEQARTLMADPAKAGDARVLLERFFTRFDFTGIEITLPTETFTGSMSLRIGDKPVELIDVGPAHSCGDLLVHLPEDRVVFVGDILFVGGHPAIWSGPVANWINVCDRILDMDVDVVVPGHGPVSDKAGVAEFRDYLSYVVEEATRCYHKGLTVAQAARTIDLSRYANWQDSVRIVIAVDTVYRELAGDGREPDGLGLLAEMGRLLVEQS